jgi:ABC-type bacteriocin/lantibiotic exporter with double-glycine peptidase domain
VSQEDIFDGSVLDNVTVGKPFVSYQNAIDALQGVGILDDINRMPDGLHTNLISGGKNLSTGLAQKIILARCIAKNPEVIILNDFFQFFSQLEQQKLIDYLTNERHRWSLIIVSTDPVIVSRCTRVVVLKQGKKIAEGTYDEIKEESFFQQLVFGELTSPQA